MLLSRFFAQMHECGICYIVDFGDQAARWQTSVLTFGLGISNHPTTQLALPKVQHGGPLVGPHYEFLTFWGFVKRGLF